MQVTLSEFLVGLFDEGRVRVPETGNISHEELQIADKTIVAFEQNYRRGLPGMPPLLFLPAARWAAVMFFRSCQFVVFREVENAVISEIMSTACPASEPASVHYSVDITFRFLPDLLKFAQNASPEDPLLLHLRRFAVQWPLSSVGMKGIEKVEAFPCGEHSCLRCLYADRVIASGDVSRLSDPVVREAVRQALGIFPDLAPKMAAACADGAMIPDHAMENVP